MASQKTGEKNAKEKKKKRALNLTEVVILGEEKIGLPEGFQREYEVEN